jgi:large subunit ribosomal protein L30
MGVKRKAVGPRLQVKQVKSGIGMQSVQRRTLRAIGLKHHQDVVEVTDTPSMRGMLFHVRHLIEVTPLREAR